MSCCIERCVARPFIRPPRDSKVGLWFEACLGAWELLGKEREVVFPFHHLPDYASEVPVPSAALLLLPSAALLPCCHALLLLPCCRVAVRCCCAVALLLPCAAVVYASE